MAEKEKKDEVVAEKTNEELLDEAEDFLDKAEARGEDAGWHLPRVGHLALASIAKSLIVIARKVDKMKSLKPEDFGV